VSRHSASLHRKLIFNNELINELVESSLHSKGLKFEEVEKTPSDTMGPQVEDTHGQEVRDCGIKGDTRQHPILDRRASVDLDKEAKALFMTLGQDVRFTICVICSTAY